MNEKELEKLLPMTEMLPKKFLSGNDFVSSIISKDRATLEYVQCPFIRQYMKGELYGSNFNDADIKFVLVMPADDNGVEVNRRIPLTEEENALLRGLNTIDGMMQAIAGKHSVLDVLIGEKND